MTWPGRITSFASVKACQFGGRLTQAGRALQCGASGAAFAQSAAGDEQRMNSSLTSRGKVEDSGALAWAIVERGCRNEGGEYGGSTAAPGLRQSLARGVGGRPALHGEAGAARCVGQSALLHRRVADAQVHPLPASLHTSARRAASSCCSCSLQSRTWASRQASGSAARKLPPPWRASSASAGASVRSTCTSASRPASGRPVVSGAPCRSISTTWPGPCARSQAGQCALKPRRLKSPVSGSCELKRISS
jgi:hypothetical protein